MLYKAKQRIENKEEQLKLIYIYIYKRIWLSNLSKQIIVFMSRDFDKYNTKI